MSKYKTFDSSTKTSLTEKILSVFLGVMISLLTIVVLGVFGL